MKRFALPIFALVAVGTLIIAEEITVQDLAKDYDTDVATIEACMNDVKTNIEEMVSTMSTLEKMQNSKLDDESNEALERYKNFLACLMEKKDIMKDSMLVLDKLLEAIDKIDKPDSQFKNKKIVTECVKTLNADSALSRGDRAIGLVVCVFDEDSSEEKK